LRHERIGNESSSHVLSNKLTIRLGKALTSSVLLVLNSSIAAGKSSVALQLLGLSSSLPHLPMAVSKGSVCLGYFLWRSNLHVCTRQDV
jgi:hypothetical protein